MGKGSHYSVESAMLRPAQRKRIDISQTTRIVTGGLERITYKEEINGVTYIRTIWRKKKKKVRKKHS